MFFKSQNVEGHLPPVVIHLFSYSFSWSIFNVLSLYFLLTKDQVCVDVDCKMIFLGAINCPGLLKNAAIHNTTVCVFPPF